MLATFAAWFGGFTFYTSVVIPIGTDILGSARAQGEITQRVTFWLNLICLVAGSLMLAEHFVRPTASRRWNLVPVLGILLVACVLIWLKTKLDGLIEPTSQSIRVIDRDRFYSIHRYYLWLSTLQWGFGWSWLYLFTKNVLLGIHSRMGEDSKPAEIS